MDLVAVSPMTSINGNVTYIQYVKGTSKGQSKAGDMVNSVYQLGKPEPDYTGDAIVETVMGTAAPTTFAWANTHGKIVDDAFALGGGYRDGSHADPTVFCNVKVMVPGAEPLYTNVTIAANGTVTFPTAAADWYKEDGTASAATPVWADNTKVAYRYDNIVVPQETLPTLKAEVTNIPLMARARRIAVFYSQIAAFQAKTDYGYDLA